MTFTKTQINDLFEEEPTADEIEDLIFNSEITEEGILRAVRALKDEKTAGLDGFVPGHLLYRCSFASKLFSRLFLWVNVRKIGETTSLYRVQDVSYPGRFVPSLDD